MLHLVAPLSLPHPPDLTPSAPTCASMLCFVAPQLAALLAPTNLFLTLITARQQAAVQWAGPMKGSNLPVTGGLRFSPRLFSWAPSVTGQQWIFGSFFFSSFFSLFSTGLKVASSKGGEKGAKSWEPGRGRDVGLQGGEIFYFFHLY